MKKKLIIIGIVVTVLAAATVGVLLFLNGSKFKTEESAILVKKNGKIVEAIIEDFDQSVYNVSELEAFINDEVREYNASVSEKRIKIKEFEVEANKAVMYLQYASAQDFETFYGETFFSGNFTQALETGYLEDMLFYTIFDGGIGTEVTLADISGDDLKVVIMEDRMGINVKGEILYVSQNLRLVDKNTVSPLEGIQDLNDYIVVIYR